MITVLLLQLFQFLRGRFSGVSENRRHRLALIIYADIVLRDGNTLERIRVFLHRSYGLLRHIRGYGDSHVALETDKAQLIAYDDNVQRFLQRKLIRKADSTFFS